MVVKVLRSSLVLVLVAAICSAGCYRDVARIQLDQSQRFVVERLPRAKEADEIPQIIDKVVYIGVTGYNIINV